jgi:hypothetical protein
MLHLSVSLTQLVIKLSLKVLDGKNICGSGAMPIVIFVGGAAD